MSWATWYRIRQAQEKPNFIGVPREAKCSESINRNMSFHPTERRHVSEHWILTPQSRISSMYFPLLQLSESTTRGKSAEQGNSTEDAIFGTHITTRRLIQFYSCQYWCTWIIIRLEEVMLVLYRIAVCKYQHSTEFAGETNCLWLGECYCIKHIFVFFLATTTCDLPSGS